MADKENDIYFLLKHELQPGKIIKEGNNKIQPEIKKERRNKISQNVINTKHVDK